MRNQKLKEIFDRLRQLQDAGDMESLKNSAQELLSRNPYDSNIRSIASGFFIDSGNALGDLSLVNQGISLIEELIKELHDQEPKIRIGREYNLSNGYGARFEIFTKQGRTEDAIEAIQRQKSLLQGLLLQKKHIRKDLLPLILTNYANLLDHLGRTVEAIDQYMDCLRIQPKHAVAMGNCANAIKRLRRVSEEHRIRNLYNEWQHLKTACNMPEEVVKISSQSALVGYRACLKAIEEFITQDIDGGLDAFKKWSVHRLEAHGYPKAKAWLKQINRDRLFLTLNQFPLDSKKECVDDLFFHSLVVLNSQEEQSRFINLTNTLNNIKEDYVTARYLYYNALNKPKELYCQSTITYYGDVYDYAKFGLFSGFLKASFRLANDCLDKLAFFINEYFNIGHPGSRVNFHNIWFNGLKPKRGEHPILSELVKHNQFLQALRDLHRDRYLQQFPGPLRDARNAATHRRLVLYWLKFPEDSEELSWSVEEFEELTFFTLRTIKAAIIYLVSLVALEEKKRASKDKGHILSLPFRLGPGIEDQDIQT